MDLTEFREQIETLNQRADMYHVDIMDGHYVKNITLSPFFIEQLKKVATIPIDAHLMVEAPEELIEMTAKAGADLITLHAETINRNAFRIINRIRKLGCKVGIAVNPTTQLGEIQPYIHLIDKLTIMTVDPGFAGQPFIEEMLDKIQAESTLKKEKGYHYEIEVDGSCNEKTFKLLENAGTEIFIVGSSGLFNLKSDLNAGWENMMAIFYREIGQPAE
jgi:D-allulose-6-phosphate 3-epimerase